MAKRKTPSAAPSRKEGGGETSRALIFFLVFSILLNLGLGIAAYFGFQHDDALKVANADLTKKNTDFKDEREWFQFQILSFHAYMGHLKADEKEKLGDLRDKFDRNQLPGRLPVKDKDEVTALIKNTLEKERGLKWNPATKEVAPTYEKLVADARSANKTLTEENLALRTAKEQAETRRKQLEDELKTEKNVNEANLVQVKADNKANLDKYFTTVEEATKALQEEIGKLTMVKDTNSNEQGNIQRQLDIAKTIIVGLKNQLRVRDARIAQLEKDLGREAPGTFKMDWRIASIEKSGTTGYINLGSADKVTTGLTFRVHGIGEDGTAKPRDKATVEVLNVVNDHLSQVRILYDYDERKEPAPQRHNPRRDPVLKGDVLYNPTWDPYQKKHVAIAGLIDLYGDGRDSLPDLISRLERQNVIVDAYLDTKDFAIKGNGITVNTDLLILGPTSRSLLDTRGVDKERRDKLDEGVRTMKKQAEDNGVKVRGLRQWLEEIGYKVPRGLVDEADSLSQPSPVKGAGEPVKPEPVKPDVPAKPDVPDAPVKPEAPPK